MLSRGMPTVAGLATVAGVGEPRLRVALRDSAPPGPAAPEEGQVPERLLTEAQIAAVRILLAQPGNFTDTVAAAAGLCGKTLRKYLPEIRRRRPRTLSAAQLGAARELLTDPTNRIEAVATRGTTRLPSTPGEDAHLFRADPRTVTRRADTGRLTSIRTLGGQVASGRTRSSPPCTPPPDTTSDGDRPRSRPRCPGRSLRGFGADQRQPWWCKPPAEAGEGRPAPGAPEAAGRRPLFVR
jgi:hypothetical protein